MTSQKGADLPDARGYTAADSQHDKSVLDQDTPMLGEDQCGGSDGVTLKVSSLNIDKSVHDAKSLVDTRTGTGIVTGEHSTDARLLGFLDGKSKESQMTTLHSVSQKEDVYDMNCKYRGHALLINNERFSIQLKEAGLGDRPGSNVDEKNLNKCLHDLGFRVTVYPNLTANQMRSVCAKMAAKDHSECDCFVLVILSHGEEGIVYGTDQTVEIKDLTRYFKGDTCSSLIGKPKIFIIQACRGYQTDPGVSVNVIDAKGKAFDETDTPTSNNRVIKLPLEADFLYAYSTVPGYYSWRNGMNGSWFVQALCDTLNEHGKTMEIRKLLTLVNRRVAQNFQSLNPDNKDFHKMKQIPCITSMLTKDLTFNTTKKKRVM